MVASATGIQPLSRSFDPRTLLRARSYVDRVQLLTRSWPIDALVQGTQLYETTIYREEGLIEGDCTCPVAQQCKHAAAVALRIGRDDAVASTEDSSSELDSVSDWLIALADATTPVPPEPPAAQAIAYILEGGDAKRILLRVGRCKRLKNGELGKPTDVPNLRWGGRPKWLEEREANLLDHICRHQPGIPQDDERLYVEKLDAFIIRELAATGRLFWHKRTQPLSIAEPRKDTLVWRRDKAGSFRLGLSSRAVLIPAREPHYLDPASASIGPLELGNAAAAAPHVNGAPSVPASAFAGVSRGFAELIGTAIEVEGEAPELAALSDTLQMRTLIQLKRSNRSWMPPSLSLQVFADYGARSYTPALAGVDDGERDLSAEASAMAVAKRVFGRGPTLSHPADITALSEFLAYDAVPTLKADGWLVELSGDLDHDVPVLLEDVNGGWEEVAGGDWFRFSLGVEVAGKTVPLLPLLLAALERSALDIESLRRGHGGGLRVELEAGEAVFIPRARIAEWLEPLLELQRFDLESDGSLKLSLSAMLGLAGALESDIGLFGGAGVLSEMRERVSELVDLKGRDAPAGFSGELRSYQRLGFAWLRTLHDNGYGGVLADDMGLGKTIQLLAFLEELRGERKLSKGRPALVVAPRSVIDNWQREATKFSPKLKTVIHHGPSRAKTVKDLCKVPLIISSYQTVVRDAKLFGAMQLSSLILDEAQAIKNSRTQTWRVIKDLTADSRFCVTGTPIENRLLELWSQFDVAMPGFLGSKASFKRHFDSAGGDVDLLRRRIRPFLLRRTKGEVETSLPAKTEVVVPIEITGKQRDLYETTRLALERKVRESLLAKGSKGSALVVLDALLKIRQVCCDPRLVKTESARKVKSSAKLERLLEMLEELSAAGRATLVFSQFASMLELIEAECKEREISTSKLTGKTRNRVAAIERFMSGEASVFLISLKAGGVGLNLTRADTVIHYDPWWNPAAEAQATDRAHRIGQDKPVFVYKLIGEGTVEEKVLEMQDEKRAIADAALAEAGVAHLSSEDLRALFESL